MRDTSLFIFTSSTLVSLASTRTTLESCVQKRGKAVMLQRSIEPAPHRNVWWRRTEEAWDYYVVQRNKELCWRSGQTDANVHLQAHVICMDWRFFLNMINAFRNAGAARASSKLLTCQCHHHEAAWDTATSSNGVDVALCSRRRNCGRRWENATRVECLSMVHINIACPTWAESGNGRWSCQRLHHGKGRHRRN